MFLPGSDFVLVTALRPLNVDGGDGRLSATDSRINKGNFFLAEAGDQITMDRTLSNEQRAAIGCGPWFGTRCDSGIEFFNPFDSTQRIFGPGGGFDPLNAEGGAVVEAMPGTFGTGVRFAPPPPISPTFTGGWTITSSDVQPGTMGFVGSPVCTRFAPEAVPASEAGPGDLIRIRPDLPLVRLPGCRGAVSTTINIPNNSVDVIFEPGYDPLIDGCIFARQIAGMDVRAVDANGNPDLSVDLANTCFKNQNVPQPIYNSGSLSRTGRP